MTEPPAVGSPGAAVSLEFAELASGEQIATAAAALERNGIRPLLAATGADARGLVGSLLTGGAEVYNNTSQTLEATGIADDIERSGRYQPLRLRLYRMDREMQRSEMRALAASPDYVVGSVHALTEGGSLLIASASGSLSAGAARTSVGRAAAAALGRSLRSMCGSGSARTSSVTASRYRPRLAPVPAPTSRVRPDAMASARRRVSRSPASSVALSERS